jgi:hypothetical protein
MPGCAGSGDGLLHDAGFDWWVSDTSTSRLFRLRFGRASRCFRDVLWASTQPAVGDQGTLPVSPVSAPASLLEVPVCIHVTCEPLEVAASPSRGTSLAASLCRFWEFYTLRSVQASVGLPLPRATRISEPIPSARWTARCGLESQDVQGCGARPTGRSPHSWTRRSPSAARREWTARPPQR